ncbi:PREDICTED: uncharacterized protein LOC106864574 [Sturnus vulgaris]|uniref:uncharacterized protein LOC106864574 n=1 Tax=Sturnus vulgaris TaxID=9172 RepID=UPI00071A1707|nr:PREDICTED: uncharacterized protein LOC106864574 [Sturnus vulgaris]
MGGAVTSDVPPPYDAPRPPGSTGFSPRCTRTAAGTLCISVNKSTSADHAKRRCICACVCCTILHGTGTALVTPAQRLEWRGTADSPPKARTHIGQSTLCWSLSFPSEQPVDPAPVFSHSLAQESSQLLGGGESQSIATRRLGFTRTFGNAGGWCSPGGRRCSGLIIETRKTAVSAPQDTPQVFWTINISDQRPQMVCTLLVPTANPPQIQLRGLLDTGADAL